MQFYLNVNDSQIHEIFMQTKFNKIKSCIYIVFKRYIYDFVHFRLRYLDTVFQNEQQRRLFFVFFFKIKYVCKGQWQIPFDINWHSTLLRWCFIKSFDFSTLYTTIPHQKLKSRLATIIRNSWMHKNGNRRHEFLVLGRKGPYFVKEHLDSKNKYTEDDIVNMLEFLVDNIFVVFGGKVFQQIVGIPMAQIVPLS